ncbi:hypothetical protein F2Q70_00012104 [Brassica cretica]|uniref:Uncharacterized protein n=1 Tax=Brassica cretica TaxID=69181 RepID=A0A8S9LVT9_BRACR|nr:hypothetical protein F2Q70_00012104 [Brassica cretica]
MFITVLFILELFITVLFIPRRLTLFIRRRSTLFFPIDRHCSSRHCDTVHLSTIHPYTVHPSTVHPDTVHSVKNDTTCGETEKIEVLILKVGENEMLRD